MVDRLLVCTALSAAALLAAGCEREGARPDAEANTANAGAPAGAASANGVPLAKTAADPSLQWAACPPVFPAGCELTVLHGDPTKPNADVFLRVPAGYAIPPHSHSSAERMVLVSGRLAVKYQGHTDATLQPGSYAYGPAGMPHRATCAAGAPCILFIAFGGPVDVEPFNGAI
jgi:quercetin dioxygenase-like cupin family protein